jgi:hypothetical protein
LLSATFEESDLIPHLIHNVTTLFGSRPRKPASRTKLMG